MSTSEIANLIDQAREPGSRPDAARRRMRRVVARLDGDTLDRLDALREHFKGASRASLIRAFVAQGLRITEEQAKVTNQEDAP